MISDSDRKLSRLNAIKNRSTRYEVILTNGTLKYRAGYTGRHSQAGVRSIATKNFDDIKRLAGTPDIWWIKPKPGFHEGEWWIGFSGRTERESILEGELVWVGSETLKTTA